MKTNNKLILTGYRNKAIKLYRTTFKLPRGIIGGLAVLFIVYGGVTILFPTGSILAIGFGVSLLGLLKADFHKKKNEIKYNLNLIKLRLFR